MRSSHQVFLQAFEPHFVAQASNFDAAGKSKTVPATWFRPSHGRAVREGPLCLYVDLTTVMLTPDGRLRPELYKPDRVHLNEAGHAIWKEHLAPLIEQQYAP